MREIARRLTAGEPQDAVWQALGMSRTVGRRKCAEIARLLGMVPPQDRVGADTAEIHRRAEAGETDAEIAVAMGRTKDSVAHLRRKAGITYGRQLRISPQEEAEIRHGLIAGQSTREVAAAVGCEQADVARRRKRIAHLVGEDRPPCRCGKPAGHGGRCDLIVDPDLIRSRLLAGATAADIAREFNRTAQNFKPKYVQPVIDQLTAAGHRCGCGKPFGHPYSCKMTKARVRVVFSDEQRERADILVRAGASVERVHEALRISRYSAGLLVDDLRASLSASGVACPCGQPLDHTWSCSGRNGEAKGRTAFRFSSAAAAYMSVETRRKVSQLARAGWPISTICTRTGQSSWRVSQMVAELDAAQLLPSNCAGCDQPRGHKGRCPLPATCSCGRPRNHRGQCRSADGRKNVPTTKLTPQQIGDLKRKFRNRMGVSAMARATGISQSVIQRLVAGWLTTSKFPRRPCACGRPAFHSGGCIVNTPGAVTRRHVARIEAGIIAGQTIRQIGEKLGLATMTVAKHSLAARERLFAEGKTCVCGRILHHRYWCSATWDMHDQPRGRRPFPEAQERQATDMLLRGDIVADIAAAIGRGADSIWRLRRSLTDEQRTTRARAVRARITRGAVSGNGIMSRIEAAVPKGLEAALRDDVKGELYLAVLEGRIEVEQIKAAVRSFVSRGLKQWQNAFGPRSLDAPLGSNDSRTAGELIEDQVALAQFDEIEIGAPQ